MAEKTTYLRLQRQQIGELYGVNGITPLEREILRIIIMVVLTETGKGVAFNFTNELCNVWLKTAPANPDIDTATLHSRPIIIKK